MALSSRQTRVVIVVGTLCACILIIGSSSSISSSSLQWISAKLVPSKQQEQVEVEVVPLPLRGSPTSSFRDNLLDNEKYITTWSDGAGFTNNVMTGINLIYLGQRTGRVPILPDIVPSHHSPGASLITFGEIFDLPRLRRELNMAVLEWDDVKDHNSTQIDSIGCWSLNMALFGREWLQDRRYLDVSLTSLPEWLKKTDMPSTYFSELERFAFPRSRNEFIGTPSPSPNDVTLPPDEHLFCVDSLYYLFTTDFNWDWDYCPPWRFVGQYLHWTPRLEEIARIYLHRALKIPDALSEPTPPYILVHARRTDFNLACEGYAPEECFPSISGIARRIEEVRAELLETRSLDVQHVVMTSDEAPESAWWDEVRTMGWATTDHSQTNDLYGHWYATLIDAVVQSGASGFIGTDGSTMSILARRRAESWHNSVGMMMKWRYPNADDH